MPEDDKYDVLEKIGTQLHVHSAKTGFANACVGHGSFGIIRKVKRKSDGYVWKHCKQAHCGC
jgi:hypothetical protein